MKVLVCGGRDYDDKDTVFLRLNEINHIHGENGLNEFGHTTLYSGITLLIEGGAKSADALARRWAQINNIPVKTINADWDKHGKSAGPIRNREMIKENPDLVIAFPGDKGTADMIKVAEKAGINVIKID